MLGPRSLLRERQNEPSMLALLRAMSVCHARAQRADSVRTGVSVLVAVSGLVAAFFAPAATVVIVLGAAWALVYSTGLASWTGQELRRAAVLQEMFDVRLYAIPWNPVVAGDPIEPAEVSRLAKRYRGRADMVVDYYEIPPLVRPYDIVACQMQNLAWGSRIRRRYALSAVIAAGGWALLGIVVGAVAELTVVELVLRWYVPSMGAVMHGVDIFRRQYQVAADRTRVLGLIREKVPVAPGTAGNDDDLLVFVRQVQDSIYRSRRETPRVPDWFFLRFRPEDRTDFRAEMDELVDTLRRTGPAGSRPDPVAGTGGR